MRLKSEEGERDDVNQTERKIQSAITSVLETICGATKKKKIKNMLAIDIAQRLLEEENPVD